MVTFQKGETVILLLTVYIDDVKTDPDSAKVTIRDPDGIIVVDGESMTKVELGEYSYDYTIPLDAKTGYFIVSYAATSGVRTTIVTDKFYVE